MNVRTFADNAGRTWTIAVNVDAIKRVRGLLDVDLLEIVEGKLIQKLIRDPVLLCDIVYAVCKPEAVTQGISDESFGRAMAGDAVEHATKALLEELVNFSPNPRERAILGQVLDKSQAAMEKVRDVVEARLARVSVEMAVERSLASVGESYGDAPESSASIPVSSPSPN